MMNLTVGTFDGDVDFDSDGLRAHLLQDRHFDDVRIDVVHPGDSVRIVHVVDAVEPRIRIAGGDWPGLIGPPRSTGHGVTHRLGGVSVLVAGEPPSGDDQRLHYREAVIDMSGAGARHSPFGSLTNVVLTYEAARGARPAFDEFERAVRILGLRASVYLAEPTRGGAPDRSRTYRPSPDRPRIAYVLQSSGPFVYGDTHEGLPTALAPTEVLDGAVVNRVCIPGAFRHYTYSMQNHALIEELLGRSEEVTLAGVVLLTGASSLEGKERVATHAANLVALLGAEGAVITQVGDANPQIEVMLTCAKLEKRGIKTTLLLAETTTEDPGLVFSVPEADAIVSPGNALIDVAADPVDAVLGGERFFDGEADPHAPGSLPLRYYAAAVDPFGGGLLRGRSW